MILSYPSTLFMLLGIPILIFFQYRQYRANCQDFAKMGGIWESEKIRSAFFSKWFLSSLCMLLTYVLLVLSLSGLSWGEEPVEEDRSGLDIIYLVDVSYSMLAEDVRPNRLERAKELIRVLGIPGARTGIIAFKGEGTVLLPPTEDIHALGNTLNYLNTEVISTPGSNLELALDKAIASFPDGSNRHQFIVLFSDGETLSGNSERSASQAARLGIAIFTYGLGSSDGAVIPLGDGLLQEDGAPVVTRLNSSTLREISRLSRGAYFEGVGGATLLSQKITGIVNERESNGFRLANVPRYRLFLMLALVAYLAQILIRSIKIKDLF